MTTLGARAARLIASVPHWYHRIEVAPGSSRPGRTTLHALSLLPLPPDMAGMRVLDIGARDGFFSFEMERRGASVTALDYMPADQTGFEVAGRLLGLEDGVRWRTSVDLDPRRHGCFDLVLFLGVLYHLRNPLLALDRIWEVCSGT